MDLTDDDLETATFVNETVESESGVLQNGEAPAGANAVDTSSVDETIVLGQGETGVEGDIDVFDASQYKPMPLPHKVGGKDIDVDREVSPAGRMVSYDLETGKESLGDFETKVEGQKISGQTEGGDGAGIALVPDKGTESEIGVENFGGLSWVSNTTSGDYKKNVKIFFNQGSSGYVCSGTLIDPKHVITAGHCVHEGDGGSWSTNVRVVPAFDDWVEPYGRANATQLHSWTGWTSDGDWDHDIGIIDLDRPVGALTGWHAYGYHDDCSYFTGGTWRQSGYPAEGPYDGTDMYTQTGDFDDCEKFIGWYGNEVSYDRLSYGGSSGTGAVRSGVVRAVLSNGNSSTTWDVRITDGKFGNIGGYISADVPSSYDLTPLNTTVSPGSIKRGRYLSSMNYLVHNYSSASVNSTYTVRVYLSTNQFISTGDTLLQTHTFSWNFGSKSSVRVNASPPYIPSSISAGTYYVGVIIDVTDASTGNNNTETFDSARLIVTN